MSIVYWGSTSRERPQGRKPGAIIEFDIIGSRMAFGLLTARRIRPALPSSLARVTAKVDPYPETGPDVSRTAGVQAENVFSCFPKIFRRSADIGRSFIHFITEIFFIAEYLPASMRITYTPDGKPDASNRTE
jgi:hypothetical protein